MKTKVLNVVAVLFGLMFLNSGLNKFFNYLKPDLSVMPEEAIKLFVAFSESVWIMPLVGLVEVVAAALIMVPKTRAFASVMIFPIVVGIFLFHTFQAPSGFVMGLILLGINTWFVLENKEKYYSMFQK